MVKDQIRQSNLVKDQIRQTELVLFLRYEKEDRQD